MVIPKTVALILATGVVSFMTSVCHADERLWLDAKINGKRARLIFDSGTDASVLWRDGARRPGLNVNELKTNTPLTSDQILGYAETCTLSLNGIEGKAQFPVINPPELTEPDFDGLIGWPTLRNGVFQIDARAQRITFLEKVPKKVSGWTQLGMVTNSTRLEVEILHGSNITGALCIDTGSAFGVSLPPREWREWKAAHSHQPLTLNTFSTLTDGVVAKEEAWADRISFGALILTNVPIREETPGEVVLGGPQDQGSLGLAVLKHFDVVIDGEHGGVYLQPNKKPLPP